MARNGSEHLFNPPITLYKEFDTPDGQDLNVVTRWANGADLQQFRKGMGSRACRTAGIAALPMNTQETSAPAILHQE
ncbi:hypothetical protein AUJ46_05730 [Candidatus Peregrinibacteria bacterium CG1_02_54_53]|nr:MAG: hypothetical protein AUJ46_05730 [Candidatus Peregrinibacteria bacterium CG1_02_54_53]